MPTYEYLCDACNHNFETVQKISEDSLKTCPSCGKDSLKRLVNAAAFHLKGSGWYKTDYGSSGSSGSSSSSSTTSSQGSSQDSAKAETKTSTDTSTNSSTSSHSCGGGACSKC